MDGNVLVALVSSGHVHHGAAQRWFAGHADPFATCPITQGALIRLLIRLGNVGLDTAVRVMARLVVHRRHRFWPEDLGYAEISWHGVLEHRQVTEAYLACRRVDSCLTTKTRP